MKRLEWVSSFELGIEEIDADHREMVDMVNDIHRLIEGHEGGKCSEAIDRFIDMMSKHFEKEEEFLARIEFPGMEQHFKYHRSLLAQAKVMKIICDEELEIGKMKNCYEETLRLLIDDVIKGDSEFKSYAQHKGHART